MSLPTTRYRVNSPDVINETIDGESVMINLRTGAYYSLTATGAAVWQAIEHRASPPEIVDGLATAYGTPHDVVEQDVARLLEQLESEELVVTDDAGAAPAPPVPGGPATGAYAAPVLEKFTDMEDLILLDPVHEVDQRGWPHGAA